MEAGLEEIAKPSGFSCPDCHGVLLQLTDQARIRFRCHTGHAYSIDSLLSAYSDQIEGSLWNVIRSLEESGLFLDLLTRHVRAEHPETDPAPLEARAADVRKDAARLRAIMSERSSLVPGGSAEK